jgi:hypothetical protein
LESLLLNFDSTSSANFPKVTKTFQKFQRLTSSSQLPYQKRKLLESLRFNFDNTSSANFPKVTS